MSDMQFVIESSQVKHLAAIAEALPDPEEDLESPLYFSGEVTVYHKDGYTVGKFIVEDDWWMLYIGGEEAG